MQDSRSQHEVGCCFPRLWPLADPLAHQNRTKAYRVLRARLLDRRLMAEMEARRSVRRGQVKGTDRSEKVRTYNFPQVRSSSLPRHLVLGPPHQAALPRAELTSRCPQDRITDHRIPLTVSGLSDAMEGGETLDMVSRELEIMEEEDALSEILES